MAKKCFWCDQEAGAELRTSTDDYIPVCREHSMKPLKRHPLSERFHELLAEAGRLHDKKQADYGREADPFANIRGSEDFGVQAWVGAILRGNDKMRRLQKVAKGGELENEGVVDSFMDLAVYALIARVLWEEDHVEGCRD